MRSREREVEPSTPPLASVPDRVSLLVVDPTVLYRESLAAALLAEAWVAEVRTAADAEGAVSALAESRPDVVLVGVSGADALRGVRVLRALSPSSRVVAIASSEDDDEVVTCAEAGVVAIVPRHGTMEDLRNVVAGVLRDVSICSARVTAALLRRVSALAGESVAPDSLTPREGEVLVLIEKGFTNKEIAQRLSIEVRTVKNHVHNLLEKLGVARRGEAAARLRSARVPIRGYGFRPPTVV